MKNFFSIVLLFALATSVLAADVLTDATDQYLSERSALRSAIERAAQVDRGTNAGALAWYGDSILAGVGATANSGPIQTANLGAPYLYNIQRTYDHVNDGNTYSGVLSGTFPGEASVLIIDAATDYTNEVNRSAFAILELGHNDGWTAAFPNRVVTNQIFTNILRFIQWKGDSNFLISATSRNAEWTNTTVQYQSITNWNAFLARTFGDRFIDTYPALMQQAVSASDQAETNCGSIPYRFFNGNIHLTDAGHAVKATNLYAKIIQLLNKTPVTVSEVIASARRNVRPYYANLTWGEPTYLGNATRINGGNMNFGGTMAGPTAFGIGGFIDGVKFNSGSQNYSIHHVPHGQGWTNLYVDLLISTSCPVGGAGGYFLLWVQGLQTKTNLLSHDLATISSTVTISGLKSNSWQNVSMLLQFTNDVNPRQIKIYCEKLGTGALTNDVYVMEGGLRGFNYPYP